ncbi:MAG TPA: glutaminyl-peptide cyclotransferase [Candidatus Limnocylindrales bacterium]|nr:glutaminyl-peptide cyclotransferase [Candidatus Limnocylindrales bacterium]
MKMRLVVAVVVIAAIIFGASLLVFLSENDFSTKSSMTYYTYSIVKTYPHDTKAFTEGLTYSDGFLFESSGLNSTYGAVSSLRRVDLTTGDVVQEYTLPSQYFGEGIAIVNDTIIQLTWQCHIGFIYNKKTFVLIGNFSYPTEGWGLTFDGKQLIMSDGSDKLYFLNPTTFQRTGQVKVHDGSTNIANINSLQYINGDVYANIWQTNQIAIINPQTGQVKAWIDLTGLPAEVTVYSNPNAVLNGIAYDQQNNRLFVTGKDWPSLYQIKLVPTSSPALSGS